MPCSVLAAAATGVLAAFVAGVAYVGWCLHELRDEREETDARLDRELELWSALR